jgi:hypothetical protein
VARERNEMRRREDEIILRHRHAELTASLHILLPGHISF